MLKSAASCLLLAACATGGPGAGAVRVADAVRFDREACPRVALQFRPTAVSARGARLVPLARDPGLPSADLIYRRIQRELGDVASADVRLCVAADGRVKNVDIVRGSGLAEFNDALARDIADWQFSALPGSTTEGNLQNCQIATINYRVHP